MGQSPHSLMNIPLAQSSAILSTQVWATEVSLFCSCMLKERKVRPSTVSVDILLYSLFNPGARWGWVVNARPRPPYYWERDPSPTVQEARWATGPVWTEAESIVPTGIRSSDLPVRSESLYRLRYPGPNLVCINRFCLLGIDKCYVFRTRALKKFHSSKNQ